jgi:hypothetical protein
MLYVTVLVIDDRFVGIFTVNQAERFRPRFSPTRPLGYGSHRREETEQLSAWMPLVRPGRTPDRPRTAGGCRDCLWWWRRDEW